MRLHVYLLAGMAVGLTGFGADVSMVSLLEQMVDRDALTYFPKPAYTAKLYSSYDRETVGKDQPGWFANWDRSEFIRVETNGLRRECVALDAKGPGAIVRFWVTIAGSDGSGILRIYIDDKLQVEGTVLSVISGHTLCPAPLSDSVSSKTPYLQRGHDLYVPIPYARSCKVTYESPKVNTKKEGEAFYYNIETRTYPETTDVESFSQANLKRDALQIDEYARLLASGSRGFLSHHPRTETFDTVLEPGQSFTKTIKGERAIRLLAMAVNAGTDEQALRSTVLEIAFDGTRTVWAPVGDFFGTGYRLSPAQTWYQHVQANGVLESSWVMPFRKNCVVTLRNLGDKPVTLANTAIVSTDYDWSNTRSMYFGAGWQEYHKAPTRIDNTYYDANYVTLTGKGLLVGTGVTLFNTANAWWGEGDEKIFIDNEAFPSFIGTGSEDYYGYAWSNANSFDHPLLTQPEGQGANAPGLVINARYRILDAVPFTQRLQFDMEIWHWADTTINYAPIAYWYLRPGGESNRKAETVAAARPVTRNRRELIPLKSVGEGRLEAETLESTATHGHVSIQNGSKNFVWSGDKQLWWTGAKPGDQATLSFALNEAGRYDLTASITHAPDYGIATIAINGTPIKTGYDAYAPTVTNLIVQLGTIDLKNGENTIQLTLTGSNEKAKRDAYLFGMDYIDLKKVK